MPYVLFKAKNITDLTVREEKWMKARPIAPTYAHPMSTLLHYAGRALYFIVNYLKGEHFILDNTNKVGDFLEQAMHKLGTRPLGAMILDIEGCYPNMPKPIIRHSMMDIMQQIKKHGFQGVYVPTRATRHKCSWHPPKKVKTVFIHFHLPMYVLMNCKLTDQPPAHPTA